jgi:tRNA A-37 threonylcarbamoyl transferase component Bud32
VAGARGKRAVSRRGDGPESGFVWVEAVPGRPLPPLDEDLAGWEIEKRRASHWNARRSDGGSLLFLKWFFHGPLARPARREWRAARRIEALGIPTVVPVGWGTHRRGSFIVLEGSPGFPASAWRAHGLSPHRLEALAEIFASQVARLHDAGLCHKDLNVYHVLVDGEGLRLIDVGRVARFRRRRWIVKDLASLLASASREGIPHSTARRFLGRYLAGTRRSWNRCRLLRAVREKAEVYRRHNEKRGN